MTPHLNPFRPTAGAEPPRLVGRAGLLDEFEYGLRIRSGAPGLLTIFTGACGVGKTVMLGEAEDAARRAGWAVISETATRGFLGRIGEVMRQLADELGAGPPSLRETSSTTQMPGRMINFSRSGLNAVWPVLHGLGWISHESGAMPSRRRRGQRTAEELVDYYGITGPCREPLIHYLKVRSASLDYSSSSGLARNLAGVFFADILKHSPDQQTFALTPQQASDRKSGVKFKAAGTPRRDAHAIYFAVRAFYLDISQWALEDAFWAQWAAPIPITYAETRGYLKLRRTTRATMQQRTRELAPVLPRLVEAAEQALRAAEEILAAATAAGAGNSIDLAGESWEVFRTSDQAPVRIRRDGKDRDVSFEEDNAFWAWALMETLRHTGARIEEVLELVHMSIQPYKVPATGETIPLLHFAPSKTDTERLMVASPNSSTSSTGSSRG